MSEENGTVDRRHFLGRSASIVGASSVLGAVGMGHLATAAVANAKGTEPPPCGNPQRAMYEAGIIAKAWQDEGYKQQLLRNPKGVLSRELGTSIPSNVNVRVVEEDANTLYFVLPRNPNEYAEKKMNAEQLVGVAAGWRMDPTPCDSVASMNPGWFVSMDFNPRSREAQRWRAQQVQQVQKVNKVERGQK